MTQIAARESMRERCDETQSATDDDYELVLRCRPRGAHLFAFDVYWDIDYDVDSCRMRSTLAFRCHASPPMAAQQQLVVDMEQRFLQLVQHCGLLRAVQIMLDLATVANK